MRRLHIAQIRGCWGASLAILTVVQSHASFPRRRPKPCGGEPVLMQTLHCVVIREEFTHATNIGSFQELLFTERDLDMILLHQGENFGNKRNCFGVKKMQETS